MREFPIYVEGYAVTGERGGAKRVCSEIGTCFADACNRAYANGKFEGYGEYNPIRLTLWGCRLYSNWTDATRNYG